MTIPKIIAHRGNSHVAPENTLAAIRLAWEQRADGVEIDVRLSSDRRLVVIHDASAKRTTGKNWNVAQHTSANLKTLDAGKWKSKKWTGEKIPVLEEVLAILPAHKKLIIEIKCGPEIITPLKKALKKIKYPAKQIAIAGFSLPLLRQIKKALPEIPTYWNFCFKKIPRGWTPQISRLLTRAKKMNALYLKACGAITPALAREVRQAGLELHVWTIDSPSVAKKMACLGVNSITTNRPEWLREKLEKG